MSSNRVLGVIGYGTMGAGIAQAGAVAGYQVYTYDVRPELIQQAYAKIGERLESAVAKGKMSHQERDQAVARLHIGKSYDELRDAEVVIEAAPEDIALKKKIFSELDRVLSPKVLRGTNTSSLSIAKLAEGQKHADRFLGIHFFNPAPVMKLIELVRGPATSDQTMVDGRAVAAFLDKTAVKVKDSPGFIGNRVNRPFYLQAMSLLDRGEADIRAIDAAVREVGGFKMGPFELLDLIGLDINLSVTQSVFEGFGNAPRFAPNPIQQKLVAGGHLGRKTGRGFYEYANGKPTPAYETKPRDSAAWKPSAALSEFAAALGKPADRAMWLFSRIIIAVINEAGLAADTIALPRDVDLTMELGFNYPQGPLGVADFVGLPTIQKLLAEFHADAGQAEWYKPNPLLDRLVANGEWGEQSAKGFHFHAL
ncbi:MAG TPA: 3-hydroxyacyl-CoA dehydrogenase NAD-binding domain-containing protein [Phycisphaerae bacterium]|nr:3-hydroxyacyl-CoA dehydrogenase NAD-binding domain-containing protein [Phycisphaerae bacterium]